MKWTWGSHSIWQSAGQHRHPEEEKTHVLKPKCDGGWLSRFSFWSSSYLVVEVGGTKDWAQGLRHAREVLCHWSLIQGGVCVDVLKSTHIYIPYTNVTNTTADLVAHTLIPALRQQKPAEVYEVCGTRLISSNTGPPPQCRLERPVSETTTKQKYYNNYSICVCAHVCWSRCSHFFQL